MYRSLLKPCDYLEQNIVCLILKSMITIFFEKHYDFHSDHLFLIYNQSQMTLITVKEMILKFDS